MIKLNLVSPVWLKSKGKSSKYFLVGLIIVGASVTLTLVSTWDLVAMTISPLPAPIDKSDQFSRNPVRDNISETDRSTTEFTTDFLSPMQRRNMEPKFFSYLNKGFLNFSTNFKNPCWYDNDKLNCLPYYYVAGMPKSGTTDLSKRIKAHKYQVRGGGQHWLTRGRFRYKDPGDQLLVYVAKYKNIADLLTGRNIKLKEPLNFITGDGSPSLFWDNERWRLTPGNEGLSEPRYTNADIIRQLNPNAKIVVTLRNPISRLYSDYLYFNKNVSPEQFHEKALVAVAVYNNCTRFHTLRYCAFDRDTRHHTATRISLGLYHVFLAEWLRVFPRKQVLVLKLEDHSSAPEVKMELVFRFLGLDPKETFRAAVDDNHANVNTKAVSVGPMLNKTRELLYKFYKPHNIKLAQLLRDKKYDYGAI